MVSLIKNIGFAVAVMVVVCSCGGGGGGGNFCESSVDSCEDAGDSCEFAKYLRIKGDTITSVNSWAVDSYAEERYVLGDSADFGGLSGSARDLRGSAVDLRVPVGSCVAMSTTYLAYLRLLGCEAAVKAVSGSRFVYDTLYQRLIAEGRIVDIGPETAPDYERIIALRPDVVLAYGISSADNSYIKNLRGFGLKVMVLNDYLENTPLARLEYLKLFGALMGRRAAADSVFKAKTTEYERIRDFVRENRKGRAPKKAIINLPYKDIWYVPGGENYISKLVADAGGEILGSKEGEVISTQESFEKMYLLAGEADVWLNLNACKSLEDVARGSLMFSKLPVFKRGMLFNNVKRVTPQGGSDFWESGAVEPEEILKDLVQIFWPEIASSDAELFADRELKYYVRLQ